MNKSIILSVLMGAALIVACDPIENRDELTGTFSADQLQISATPVVVDGQRSNKIILENHSPVLSFWNYGTGTIARAYAEVLVTSVGDVTISFTGKTGDGSTITKDLVVNVETIAFEVEGMDLFIGDGSKTWVFDAFTDNNHPYGIGGAPNDKSPTWWGPEYGEFDEWDAKMTFSLDGGAIFTKTLSDGTVQKGSFSFNLAKKVGSWSQGILSLKGTTIPHSVSVNNSNGDAYDFYIITLTEDQLILSNVSGNGVPDAPNGEANFWMFRPEGFELADNSEQIAALTGGSEKTWGWAAGSVFGNGGSGGTAPAWWTMDAAGVNDQKPNEGAGATMVFTKDGALTLHLADGTTVEGTYAVNMGKFIEGWSIGTLTTPGAYVLAGYSPNAPDKFRVDSYHILKLDDNNLTVAHIWDGEPDAGWFWVFTAQ